MLNDYCLKVKKFVFFVAVSVLTAFKAIAISDGTYNVWTAYEGLYLLDANNSRMANGTNIHLWEQNGTKAQEWVVENRDGGIVLHSAIDYNYVIDVDHSQVVSGTNIQLWQANGTNAQLWYPEAVGNKTYILRSALNRDYVLDLSGSRLDSGTNIQLWLYNGTDAQKWIISSADGPGFFDIFDLFDF